MKSELTREQEALFRTSMLEGMREINSPMKRIKKLESIEEEGTDYEEKENSTVVTPSLIETPTFCEPTVKIGRRNSL